MRRQFGLSEDYIHLSALFIASHPGPVREAIERHRRELDENPVTYLQDQNRRRQNDVLAAAAKYLGAGREDIALTDSTTMGLGLVYNGLELRPGDEVLTTEHDYYVTHESVRLAAERAGASVRQVALYDQVQTVSEDEIVGRISAAMTPATRVLAVTWVHSGTGLKLPLRRIADVLEEVNDSREEPEQVLFCVDGVHGFGVEDVEMRDLGCDFFIAGCHKWLFGPRGTGIICGNDRAWGRVRPIIPSFIDDGLWQAWLTGTEPSDRMTGRRMSPGGFKAFEHQYALVEAFSFHQEIGKPKIAARTHELARQLKEGLAQMPHINLYTPPGDNLSSGIVCFEVKGMSPWNAVERLRSRRIVATVTPYATRLVRFGPSIRNSPGEVEAALRAVHDLG